MSAERDSRRGITLRNAAFGAAGFGAAMIAGGVADLHFNVQPVERYVLSQASRFIEPLNVQQLVATKKDEYYQEFNKIRTQTTQITGSDYLYHAYVDLAIALAGVSLAAGGTIVAFSTARKSSNA